MDQVNRLRDHQVRRQVDHEIVGSEMRRDTLAMRDSCGGSAKEVSGVALADMLVMVRNTLLRDLA